MSSDFCPFEPLKKHLIGKQFAVDTEVKQAVTYWLQTCDISFFYTQIQALVPCWNIWLNVNSDYVESGVYHLLHMAMYLSKSETNSWHQTVCFRVF